MASLRLPLSAAHGAPQKKHYRKLPPESRNKFLLLIANLLACFGLNWMLNSLNRKKLADLKHVELYNKAVFAFNRLPEFASYWAIIARDRQLRKELRALHDDYQTPVLMAKRVDRERQLHAYLARIGLFNAKHLIDAVKIALLEQNDMVSAAAIANDMANIKGIGKQTMLKLMEWRAELTMKFIYIPDECFIEILKRDRRATYAEKSLLLLLELDDLQHQWANLRSSVLEASILFDKQHLNT